MIRQYTYKFALFPTPKQEELLSKHFGCIRWVFNHFLDGRVKHYMTAKEQNLAKKSLNYYDDAGELTKLKKQPETEWLSEVNSQSLQHAIKHLDGAFNRFYKKLGGFPKFKKRNRKNSFRVPQFVVVEDGKLYFPKFKEGIKIDQHRPIEGEIQNATVCKMPSGRYYASIQVERDIQSLPSTGAVVGVDLGIKALATTSDGVEFPNLKPFRKYEKRIRILNKALSRCVKGSKGREKARKRLAKVHEKVADIRNNHLHNVSKKVVDKNQIICLETLNVSGMMKNRKLSKSIWDCSLFELVRQIKYKADWYGRQVVQVDRWFPSSKTCSKCHFIKDDLTLADREWTCPRCKEVHNRDVNAAQNILVHGLNLLNKVSTVGTTGIAKCLGVSPASAGN
jgi:putative transposase